MDDLTSKQVSDTKTAKYLGKSVDDIKKLNNKGINTYSESFLKRIRSNPGLSISDEAVKVAAQIQHETVSSLSILKKIIYTISGGIVVYLFFVLMFVVLLSNYPIQTAEWLGYIPKSSNNSSTDSDVLGAQTTASSEAEGVLYQVLLQPLSGVSLNILKVANPKAYEEITKVTILDLNKVLALDEEGRITPVVPLKLPASSYLDLTDPGLIPNLNSQFLQGRQPGSEIGDLMIVGGKELVVSDADSIISSPTLLSGTHNIDIIGNASSARVFTGLLAGDIVGSQISTSVKRINGSALGITTPVVGSVLVGNGAEWASQSISNDATINASGMLMLKDVGTPGTYGLGNAIPFITTDSKGRVSGVVNTPISGLTDSNLSGSAGIANANLANSLIDLTGNSGSGSVSLGGVIDLTGAGITTTSALGSTITVTSTEADTLQSVFDRGDIITTTNTSGLLIDSTSSIVGIGDTLNGLRINGPTTIPSLGGYNNLYLGTSTGSAANTLDLATISVGSISSTAQQNFSTLNLKNGGSGYLDIEVIHGFINFQNVNQLYEDFMTKSLDTADKWTSTSTGIGSNCSILAGGLNGLFRMNSGGAANRGCELTTQVIGSLTNGYYQRSNNPVFETKLRIDTVTNARIFAGFTNTRIAIADETNPSTHHAYIAKRAADTTWLCVTDDGGATETITDTGVTIVADTFYRLRVELRNGTTPQTICTIDDGTIVTRTIVTATQPGATSPMDIYVKLNQSDGVVKNMDVDYVRVWQQ